MALFSDVSHVSFTQVRSYLAQCTHEAKAIVGGDCYRKRSACVVLGLHLARNIALACCSCTRSHCIALIAFALLWVRNTLDSIALGLQRFGLLRVGIATDVDCIARIAVLWIASRLRLHRLELHRLELRCLELTAVALICIAGRVVNRCILHRLDCNAWIAWLWIASRLGLHRSELHRLDLHCFECTAAALVCMAVAEWLQMLGKSIIAESCLQPQHWRRTRYGGWPFRPVWFWREIRVGCVV